MDILDRLLAHDAWTTRRLLQQCQQLSDEALDQAFEIDHHSLRETFVHMIGNMEIWNDLLHERQVRTYPGKEKETIEALLARLSDVAQEFATLAKRIAREHRADDVFVDALDNPPQEKTFGGAIAHVITHNMHHRAQVMYLMEQLGLRNHLEGDVLSWEFTVFGWR
jgi:uncharacterized damage-inducible protein DinB